MGADHDTGGAGRYERGAALLSIGVGASGALTYAYFALASNELDPDDYGNLVLLWSVLFVALFTLYRPVEQLVSRGVSERRVAGERAAGAVRSALRWQVAIALVFVLAAVALRSPIEDGLLGGSGDLYLVFLVAGPAYAASFLTRGYLAGSGRFALYGTTLLLESVSRLLPAVLVSAGIAEGVSAIALGIAAAPLVSLAVVPPLLLGRNSSLRASAPGRPPDSDIDVVREGRFVVGAFAIMLSEQVLLNAGVVILGATASVAAAGLLFNVLLLARAPQVLFGAVTTALLPSLTRHRSIGGVDGERAFRDELRRTLAGIAAAATVIALVVLAAGPELMRLTFGDGYEYERAGLLLVVVGMAAHLSSLTLTQAELARDRAATAALRWGTCALAFVVWSFLPVLDDVLRIELGYAGAAISLCALLLLEARRAGDA